MSTPVRLRFSRAARLTRDTEFRQVKERGRSVHGRLMVLSFLSITPAERTRVGLITSRRVGGAVDRNRTRRRLREIVRVALPTVADGWWLVLVARKAAVAAKTDALRDEWTSLAGKAHLFRA